MDFYLSNYLPEKELDNYADIINKLIQECFNAGGGTIYVDGAKTYMCGSIELKNNVGIYICKDTCIKLSSNLDDFIDINIKRKTSLNRPSWENCEYNGKPTKYFIYANDVDNISIKGEGMIDGNEEIFYGNVTKWHIEGAFYPRIPLIYFENSSNIILNNITLRRSAFWTLHLVGCDGILVDGITIDNNLKMTNCDGIDPDHSKNIVIKNCNISSADDCIVFKATEAFKKYGATENILVQNCNLTSTSAAIKFGTESVSDFKNIKVKNVNITKSNRGISLQLRDEGSISDISFEDIIIETRRFSKIHWWGKGEGIAITALRRKETSKVGNVSKVSFKNIKLEGENGIFIYGENNINDITFDNIMLKLTNKTNYPKTMHDIRPCYTDGLIEGDLNALYINSASDITFNNFDYTLDSSLSNTEYKDIEIINSANINIEKKA